MIDPTDIIWYAIVNGEPASKANSRKLVTINEQTRFIKSDKARSWERAALFQLNNKRPAKPFSGELAIECRCFYETERPDLDPSLVYDVLQRAGVVGNDRQFREQHCYHFIDKTRPRVEIAIAYRRRAAA